MAAAGVVKASVGVRARLDYLSEKKHLSLYEWFPGTVDFARPLESVVPSVQGRILAVLAETTAELNLRTIARLADVSVAQASRVLPKLVELGIVERREVLPSALFLLVRGHVAAEALLEIAAAPAQLMDRMGQAAQPLPMQPLSIVVFGSFARGEADRASDIDAVLVRPSDVDEDDETWAASIERWRNAVTRTCGNHFEVLEVCSDELPRRLHSRAALWREIRRDGIVVH